MLHNVHRNMTLIKVCCEPKIMLYLSSEIIICRARVLLLNFNLGPNGKFALLLLGLCILGRVHCVCDESAADHLL